MQKITVDRPTIVFIIAAALALAEAVAIPVLAVKIVRTGTNIARLKASLALIGQEWPQKELYEQQKVGKEKEVAAVASKFLKPQEESKIFSFVSTHSKEFSIEIQSLSPAKPEEYRLAAPEGFKYFPLKLRARGEFHNLSRFLGFLQSSEYFFEGVELSIMYDEPYDIVNVVLCGLITEE